MYLYQANWKTWIVFLNFPTKCVSKLEKCNVIPLPAKCLALELMMVNDPLNFLPEDLYKD